MSDILRVGGPVSPIDLPDAQEGRSRRPIWLTVTIADAAADNGWPGALCRMHKVLGG